MIIVDVLALTSLQRDLPGNVLSRVLGVFDTLVLGGILLASLGAGILLAHADLNVALIAVGIGIPVIALAGLPTLLRADRTSAAVAARLRPRVALLSQLDLLAGADHNTLERLAGAAEEVVLPAGSVVIREGDEPDALWVLEEGELSVSAAAGGGGAPRAAAGDRPRLCRGTRSPARHPPHRHGAHPRAKHTAAHRRPGVPVRAADQPAKRLNTVGGRDAYGPHSDPHRPLITRLVRVRPRWSVGEPTGPVSARRQTTRPDRSMLITVGHPAGSPSARGGAP